MLATTGHKINLGLHVIEKMPSGYHTLETVFYPCHHFKDTLEITRSAQFSFTVKDADFHCKAEDNLCVKAYRLLQNKYDLSPVEITLTKHIPSGAGLGGGSADAALTLKMLNELFSLQLSIEPLHEFAVQLGSDVAFFLYNTPMYATGRGDILEPFTLDLSNFRIEIVCPDISISTAQAYSAITPKKPKVSLKQMIQSPIAMWKENLMNDFEEVIFKQHPKLMAIKQDFYRRGAVYASMSGSGSAVYGIF
ncbi:MAG: 4-(cytidine 5'-diphospho)-2-C-methyl-D-erythritol kinase [Bacteroidetes bacterium]|nr:4-(cytidine 5'-diphospho)-2-C-methyl-D-erythritol kinase [Bacteroidota bacterium]MCL1969205.1 4-(cytidine 5'-diphospho)-2-C-methyl-D-erythritol kinase [Bacteroidota bacterium]